MKKHCATVLLLIAFFLVSIHFAEAQQPKGVFRVGVLEPGFRRPEAQRLQRAIAVFVKDCGN